MLHKPKISTLKHLHSIPRYFMHSIPIGSIVALLTLTLFTINPSPHINIEAYAIEDTNVRDTIGTTNSNNDNNDLDTVEREDSTVAKANTGENVGTAATALSDATPLASLTITPGAGGNGAGQDETVLASTGAVAYRSHNITVDAQDITKYSLQVSYAGGNDKMYLEDKTAYLDGAGGKTPAQMANNSWGFAWGNTSDVDSNMIYYTMPKYNENATNIQSGLLENQDTYSTNFTKKLVFAAKFGSNATAGHYKTAVMLSLTASPKEVTTTLDDIFQMQQMTPEICRSSVVGETNSEVKDQRDSVTYTIRKHEDGKCWMQQNLKLSGEARTLTPDDSDVKSNWRLPASKTTNTGNDFMTTSSAVSLANNNVGTYGAYYNWYAATAGTGTTNLTNKAIATSSICPKGWKLPTRTDYEHLVSAASLTGATIKNPPYSFSMAGFVPSESAANSGVGTNGRYWSSVFYKSGSTTGAYDLNFSGSGLRTDGYSYGANGLSVRCVAKTTFEHINAMQDMTNSFCANAMVGTSANLIDTRNNKVYTVEKLLDNKCWMMDSLNLIGAKTLKSSDSDVTNDYSLPATDSSPWSSTDPSIQKLYNTTPTLYTWCAATAGSCIDMDTDGAIASESICPKGWHLPTSAEYKELIDSGFTDGFADSNDAISISGGKLNHHNQIGIGAQYWSSSAKSNVQAYSFNVYGDIGHFGDGDMLSLYNSNKYVGLPIRCVAR